MDATENLMHTSTIKGRNQRVIANEICGLCKEKGANVSFNTYAYNVFYKTNDDLKAVVLMLESAMTYYKSIKKTSLAIAAEGVRSVVVEELVANGGNVPQPLVGGRTYFQMAE